MFRRYPSISFFDFPLVFHVVQDFYFSLRSENKSDHAEMMDRDVLEELRERCEHLLDKIKDVCIENNLELNYPS
jgi:hypothetical protein